MRGGGTQDLVAAVAYLKEAIALNQKLEDEDQYFALDNESLASCYEGVGIALSMAGQYDQAVPYLEQAVKIDPQIPDGEQNLALATKEMNRVTIQSIDTVLP